MLWPLDHAASYNSIIHRAYVYPVDVIILDMYDYYLGSVDFILDINIQVWIINMPMAE